MGFILKLFKSRFFIISLAVALLVSIVPGVLCAMGQGSYIRSAIITVASPFRWVFTKAGEGLSGFSLYFKTLDELRDENAALRAELEDYQNKVYDAELIMEENDFLSDYLGIKEEHVDFLFESATVVGREATNYRSVLTLSKGTMHGIEVNMPVITEKGLLGRITEVGSTWSKADIIIESSFAVGAYIERSEIVNSLHLLLGNELAVSENVAKGAVKVSFFKIRNLYIGQQIDQLRCAQHHLGGG
jgi:rod shape-determining protein MreC